MVTSRPTNKLPSNTTGWESVSLNKSNGEQKMKCLSKKLNRLVLVVLIGLGSMTTGCVDPTSVTFWLGYLVGQSNAPTTTTETCTVNGEAVDCSTLQ